MKNLKLFLVLIVALSIFQSCQKETLNEVDTANGLVAPDLPTADMYSMPLDEVSEENFNSEDEDTKNSATYKNVRHASGSLLFWHTAVNLNMAIPTSAFAAAFNHDPTNLGDGVFEWSYDHTTRPELGSDTYNVSLIGKYINELNEVEWTMTVSKVGGFTDVVWYEGIVSRDSKTANFTLYHQPNNPEPYWSIDYQKFTAETDASLRYTNIVPNGADNGKYIEYSTQSEERLNRAFDVFLSDKNFLEIEWKATSKEGRVKHPTHFNDEEWHCWSASKEDMDCE